MKKVKIEVMLQGYGDSHFATSVEEIIEVDDNAPIADLWAKRIYVEEVTATDKLSVEKLQEELESCIQTLIEASEAANITQDIVVGNLVDRKLAGLAKTHKLAVDYIEKVTGKNIDVVLAENAALEAEEDE
ncbi:hypothetical protein [Lactococcus lactis]|uniref:hypothetical protein n=1 Tax=Lactococcus lactis TaxID=1358 RepID=UPI0021A507D8|nr:hypothetical protein [Lactococcus lactis]